MAAWCSLHESSLQCLLVRPSSFSLELTSNRADLRALLPPLSPQPRHRLPLASPRRTLPSSERHAFGACCHRIFHPQHLPNDHGQPTQLPPPSPNLLRSRLRLQHDQLLLYRHQRHHHHLHLDQLHPHPFSWTRLSAIHSSPSSSGRLPNHQHDPQLGNSHPNRRTLGLLRHRESRQCSE